jgi:SAM-dependent methyltransferase
MNTEQLLEEISTFCRRAGMAESTFGRRVVNDGKLVQRLRHGGRITTDTLDRIRSYLSAEPNGGPHAASPQTFAHPAVGQGATILHPFSGRSPSPAADGAADPKQNFRFFDNRQKYLLFVNTCSEKQVISGRVALELANIHPRPPAVRVFDAGVGDGTVLSRVLRAMHRRFTHMPFYVAGKEISLEDIRLTLDKMPDRLFEHPATVFVLTNMYYSEAPWLTVKSPAAANSLVWHEAALSGSTSREFEEQIAELHPFLADNWKARVSDSSGNPVYERPVVLVLYREDHRFLLDPIIPHPGRAEANFDLVIASQPYRARSTTEFKAKRVVAPLARALRPGGRLIAIHSHGNDPGMEIIQRIWPGENPFVSDRHAVLRAVKQELGPAGRDLNFNAYADSRSIFQYKLETLPNEITGPLGTSTVFAAWNAAIYVAQMEDERLTDAVQQGTYLDATGEVLRKYGGLWFNDESFVISRQRD